MVNQLYYELMEALPDFTIKGDIQSDLQSLAYIPPKLPEELKIELYMTTSFWILFDLDSGIIYRLAEGVALLIATVLLATDYAVYQVAKL